MSFTLTKVLSLLLYPLSSALLVCVFSILLIRLHRLRTGLWCLTLGVAWLYLSSTTVFANFLTDTLEQKYVPRAMSVVPEVDAIVLLGGATRGDTHMSTLADLNRHADRLVHTVALYKAGRAPMVLVTGGTPSGGGRSEARQMTDLLGVMGVPARHIVLEDLSRNTYENAFYSAQLLHSEGIQMVLLVTSAYHMRRAEALFEAQGLTVVPAPTDYQHVITDDIMANWVPTVGALHQTTDALHEIVGFWVYRLRGWL